MATDLVSGRRRIDVVRDFNASHVEDAKAVRGTAGLLFLTEDQLQHVLAEAVKRLQVVARREQRHNLKSEDATKSKSIV